MKSVIEKIIDGDGVEIILSEIILSYGVKKSDAESMLKKLLN